LIDLSEIDDFFKLNQKMWVPSEINLHLETNIKKIFECVPVNAPYAESAKLTFDDR